MTIVGSGDFTYEVIENWGSLPEGWSFGGVGSVAVDSQDRVYAFQRKDPPILVFDREGTFLSSWGDGLISFGHGIHIGPDDIVYLTDPNDHVTMTFTLDGKPLMVLGNRGQPSDTGCEKPGGKVLRPGGPFNMPTQMVPSPSGDLYVSDGYRNCRVHRFSKNGEMLSSWGVPGGYHPGELWVVHCCWVDTEGTVYVCDRDNSRVQVFSATGEFIAEWTEMYRPMSIYMDANETVYISEGTCFIREVAWVPEPNRRFGRISMWDKQGHNLARLNTPSTHWIYGDSRGDLYAAEAGAQALKKYVKQA